MPGLIAKKGFRYGGRSLVAGDKFEASAKDARLLKAIKKAVDAAEEVAVERDEPTVKAKAVYRTRRMKAEDAAPVGEAEGADNDEKQDDETNED